MASSLQGQENGDLTSVSTMLMDDEVAGFMSSNQKALQNNVILRNIFDLLSLSDLKKCRQINQIWKNNSQHSYGKKCKAIGLFANTLIAMAALRYKKMRGIEEMPDLIELILTSGSSFPCKSFTVECSIKHVSNTQKEAILLDFFFAIAPFAETIRICEMDERIFNGKSPQNLHFRCLKTFSFFEFVPSFEYPRAQGSNLKFCQKIIENSPELQELCILFNNSETASKLITPIKTAQGHKISNLSLSGPLDDNLFNTMTALGLKLYNLELNIDEESIITKAGESLRDFLSNQRKCLKVLYLRSNSLNMIPKLRITFPVMTKLTQLRFELRSLSEIELSRISYAEQFPLLQSLIISQLSPSNLDSLFDFRNGPVNKLTTLELPMDLNNPSLIWRAARIFPNVTKLVLPSRKRIVMSAYEAWQKVEDLTINLVWNGDSADSVLCTFTKEFHGLSPQLLDRKDIQPVEFLHNLKVLRLKHRRHFALSDDGCRLVLLKLRSLTRLELSKGPSETYRVSKEVLQEMRDKFSVIC